MLRNMRNILIVAFFLTLIANVKGQVRQVSENLNLIKLSAQTYMHSCENNNGLVYINNKEAIIISTPDSDQETQNLIDWVRNEGKAKIVGYVIDRWHPDAMEGLDVVKQNHIKSYAYELTRQIAGQKKLPVPDVGFDPKLDIEVGNSRVICHFLGEAHTADGIVVWVPDEKILFGGNGIRNLNGWVGNIADANLGAWSETARNIKDKYGDADVVVPGHGNYGGIELIDYTIDLYKHQGLTSKVKQDVQTPKPEFNKSEDYVVRAKLDTLIKGIRYLHTAIVYAIDSSRCFKLESPLVLYDAEKKQMNSESGKLSIYNTFNGEYNQKSTLQYKNLSILKIDDAVGFRLIIREFNY